MVDLKIIVNNKVRVDLKNHNKVRIVTKNDHKQLS